MLPTLSSLSLKDELEDGFRASFGVNDTFKLMFLGGSPRVDSLRRERYQRCGIKIAGNHTTADIQGDWSDQVFWQRINQENPTAIVVDYGSDSWMTEAAQVNLATYINTTHTMLIFSPRLSEFASPLMTDHPLRYNLSIFDKSPIHFLLTLWSKLPEQEYFASEIFKTFPCESYPSVEEIKECFEKMKVFGPQFDTFDDAVAFQISLFSACSGA